MVVLVVYSTTEGHTRRIARRAADRIIASGQNVEILPAGDADIDAVRAADAVVLAASIHVSQYQQQFTDFLYAAADALEQVPTLFLSVSLAAAGHDSDEWKGLDAIVTDMSEATGMVPKKVVQVAGAYQPSRYDPLRRLIMRRIIHARDPDADPKTDHVYTDWAALDKAVDGWLADAVSRSPAEPA